ncbi:Dihydroxy-acid dehydratase [Thermobaculum terrenum ATCC BAA-798]|uniref:Dihydroxy-acid dehydratase n=1 Tax=Thermobaculum terrenum (strain ATCC BAA-798 / CCMEE 7001 / YNP1) TaxID=525904 RepID=D1CGJ3_THET1|nr:dihydroxy-acid dehydratase [Thermobaculum terrenum]ACZ42864.1 Dihydroxy-acid dehydratase [Thermobaculum terrenum ATCC BAA-798]
MELRSRRWFDRQGELGLQHRSVLRTLGMNPELFRGKPVIGIANTWSELNNCNLGLRALAAAVKRGVMAAGGVPLEFNSISLGEELMKPTAMLYRNLLAMEVEETLRSYPIDGVVLLGGCDKTIPAQLMAAASANIPAIQVCAGPKIPGCWRGHRLGSGVALWEYMDKYRLGEVDGSSAEELEARYSASVGTCNTMGTASTMAVLAEALGMMLPGTSTIPAVDSRRLAAAEKSGFAIVNLVQRQIKPSDIMTRDAFENALIVYSAIGGSTNAVIHLLAMAGRLGIDLQLADFDRVARMVPMLVDVEPSGEKLMDDFDAAGGVPALMRELQHMLSLGCLTVTGETLGKNLESAPEPQGDTIRSLASAPYADGSIAVLHGNLVPRGAILRTSTASPDLLRHSGPALVFESYEDMLQRIDDPDLPVTPSSVLVLRNAGPVGGPGMPEWGAIPIPRKMLSRGIKDMLRISDARMSGTSSGTIVLHACPEAAVGGPLGLLRDGDMVEIDVASRKLSVLLDEEEMDHRRQEWRPPPRKHVRGYPLLYMEHVLQADEGCDFDFLRLVPGEDLGLVEPVVGRS